MATIKIIEEGYRNVILLVSGPGGDSLAKILDVTTLNPPCAKVKLKKISYNLDPTGTANLFWEATTNGLIFNLSGGAGSELNFPNFIPNTVILGVTGNVLLTTSLNPYSLYLHFIKSDPILP